MDLHTSLLDSKFWKRPRSSDLCPPIGVLGDCVSFEVCSRTRRNKWFEQEMKNSRAGALYATGKKRYPDSVFPRYFDLVFPFYAPSGFRCCSRHTVFCVLFCVFHSFLVFSFNLLSISTCYFAVRSPTFGLIFTRKDEVWVEEAARVVVYFFRNSERAACGHDGILVILENLPVLLCSKFDARRFMRYCWKSRFASWMGFGTAPEGFDSS